MTTTTEGTGTRIRRRAAVVALAAAGAIALIGPSSAHALGVTGTATPADTAAGANSDLSFEITFSDATDDVKNLTIGLPPGQVGNPTVTPTCSVADLNADACDPVTQVGSVTTNLNATVVVVPVPLTAPGTLYNLEPQPGEPARFGIVLEPLGGVLGKVILQSGTALRPDDFGLDTIINDIPRTAPPLLPGVDVPIDITSMVVDLQGMAGTPPQGFLRNPTSCNEAVTTFTATSYDGATATTPATDTDSYTPTGCDQLPFSPEFSAVVGSPGHTANGLKPPVTTAIEQTIEEAGLRRARVILPTNVTADLGVLAVTCPLATFEAGGCPASTIVGSAVATSPLLSQGLTGPVVTVANPGGLPRVGLDLTGPMHLQLLGDLVVAPGGTGLEFAGLPDIPISRFALTFVQDRLVANRGDLCDGVPRLFSTEFESHGGVTLTGTKAATIDGCTAGGPAGKKSGKGKCKKKGKGKRRDASAAKKKKKKCKRKKRRKK